MSLAVTAEIAAPMASTRASRVLEPRPSKEVLDHSSRVCSFVGGHQAMRPLFLRSPGVGRRAWAPLSNLRGRPAPHLGVRESPCRSVLAYRLTEERLTSNRRAA